MSNTLFRKKSLDRITSPEQLDEYLHVTSPSVWILLAAAILACNTLVLEYLVGSLGIGRMFAKILTELLFFAISWSVQRSFIFKRGTETEKGVVI